MRRHQIFRVFVTQLIHIELTQVGNHHGLSEHFIGIQLLQGSDRAQCALGVTKALIAKTVYIGFQANSAHNVLQALALWAVGMHIIDRHDWQL